MDFKNLSFNKIKEHIEMIGVVEENLISTLKNDHRKNVVALGEKLQRDKEKEIDEIKRVKGMYDFDKSHGIYPVIAGVDEVGRGPLAGPIVAAAVILDLNNEDNIILGIKDSKKLSPKKRLKLSKEIREKAVAYYICAIDNKEIDNKGIAYCNNEVFKRAIENLKVKPDLILSDGYPVSGINIENKYFHKGDDKSISIAAASIIAKVFRDEIMTKEGEKYPMYNFKSNMGYGTEEHVRAIKINGASAIHRYSFLKNIL